MVTNALAGATYAGNPSAMGRSPLARSSSSNVPMRTFAVACAAADHRNPSVPAVTSRNHSPTPAPTARRIS